MRVRLDIHGRPKSASTLDPDYTHSKTETDNDIYKTITTPIPNDALVVTTFTEQKPSQLNQPLIPNNIPKELSPRSPSPTPDDVSETAYDLQHSDIQNSHKNEHDNIQRHLSNGSELVTRESSQANFTDQIDSSQLQSVADNLKPDLVAQNHQPEATVQHDNQIDIPQSSASIASSSQDPNSSLHTPSKSEIVTVPDNESSSTSISKTNNKITTTLNSFADDEHASESASTASTEAYNSEDEHAHAKATAAAMQADVPMRTLREREAEFATMLSSKGLRIVEMRADGNCLFRSLAYSVWGDPERHLALRASVMQYLVQERDYFSQFVAEDFRRYVCRKRREGTHGNHLELQAAAELFGRPIEVYSYSAVPATIIDSWGTPATTVNNEPIRLSFHRGSHYNAVQSFSGPDKADQKKAAADAVAAVAALEEADLRAAADARATEDEMERAVMALSLIEATRGDSAPGSSSSASAAIPSSVLALINSGYSEEQAMEAYRIAGHGGLSDMIRFLTTDFFQTRDYTSTKSRAIPSIHTPPTHRFRRRTRNTEGASSLSQSGFVGSSESRAMVNRNMDEDSSTSVPKIQDPDPTNNSGTSDQDPEHK